MNPISKVNVKINENWKNIISFVDDVIDNFKKNKSTYMKHEFSWASSIYNLSDGIILHEGTAQFNEESAPAIFIRGGLVTKKCPWAEDFKRLTQEIPTGGAPILFYIMRQEGIVKEHVDREYEIPVLQYFINQSNTITYCNGVDQTYNYIGNIDEGYILDSKMPHCVKNPENKFSYTLNFRYRAPYEKLYEWFCHNNIEL